MNYMRITIQCSNCGKRRRVSTNNPDGLIKLVRQGWNSCGSALYCLECSKTWKDRNGDRPMAGAQNTIHLITLQAARAMEADRVRRFDHGSN